MHVLLVGLALLVFAFVPGHPYRLEQYDLPKDIALGVMGGVSALHLLLSKGIPHEDRMWIILAAFLGWGVMIAPLVGVNQVLAWRTLGLFAAAAAVFFQARQVGADSNSYAAVFEVAILIIGAMCALVLLEAYGGIPFLSAPGRRPGATLGNRNLAAQLACMALPLLWARLVVVDRRAIRFVLLVVLSATSAAIMLSRSRGALLVSCGLSILLPVATRWRSDPEVARRWRTTVPAWVAALAFGSSAAVVLPNQMNWSASDFASSVRRAAEYRTGTGQGRLIQASTTWRMIRRHPLWGVGPGNWSVVYPAYALPGDPSVKPYAFYPGPQTPKNDVLATVAEWGAVGVVLGFALLTALLRRIAPLLTSRYLEARMNGVAVLGIVLAAATLGLFESILRVAPTVYLLALLVGFGLGQGEVQARLNIVRTLHRPMYTRRAVWGVYTVLSFAFAHSAARDLDALRIINSYSSLRDLLRAVNASPNNVEARGLLSFVLVSTGHCDLAMPHLTRAAQLQPLSLFFTTLRARCSGGPESGRRDL